MAIRIERIRLRKDQFSRLCDAGCRVTVVGKQTEELDAIYNVTLPGASQMVAAAPGWMAAIVQRKAKEDFLNYPHKLVWKPATDATPGKMIGFTAKD